MSLILILIFILGICVGSFLNVLIDRLPNDETILGRSHCDNCKKTLESHELIPIVSFLIQRAKCRNCKSNLSWQYPLIELITGLMFVLLWVFPPKLFMMVVFPNLAVAYSTPNILIDPSILTWQYVTAQLLLMSLFSSMLVMFMTDLKYFIIPHWIQLSFAVITVALYFVGDVDIHLLVYRLGCGIVTMLPFLCLYQFTKGRGLGFADVILAANIGLLAGIKYGFIAFYISFIVGAVIGSFLLFFRKKGMKSKIPFGPFLLIGVVLMIYYFDPISSFLRFTYGI
jgi:leader peptidase (prepilin peptidase)/N-methyltransferase